MYNVHHKLERDTSRYLLEQIEKVVDENSQKKRGLKIAYHREWFRCNTITI